jgi:hypothetical protein
VVIRLLWQIYLSELRKRFLCSCLFGFALQAVVVTECYLLSRVVALRFQAVRPRPELQVTKVALGILRLPEALYGQALEMCLELVALRLLMLLVPRRWSPLLSVVDLGLRFPELVRCEAVRIHCSLFLILEVYLYSAMPGCGLFETLCYLHYAQRGVYRHSQVAYHSDEKEYSLLHQENLKKH